MKFRPAGAELLPEDGRTKNWRIVAFCGFANAPRNDMAPFVTKMASYFQHHMQADNVRGLSGELRPSVLRIHLITAHIVENVDECSALRGRWWQTVWLRCVPVGHARLTAFRLVSEFVRSNMNAFGWMLMKWSEGSVFTVILNYLYNFNLDR
jgi:hypothetical protein